MCFIVAEKERAKKEAERESASSRSPTSSLEEDIPTPSAVTRRVVIGKWSILALVFLSQDTLITLLLLSPARN